MIKRARQRFFHAWFRFSRSLTLGVRGLVQDDSGRILLVRHTYVTGLYFPGGGVERGELASTSLKRELVEEAGIEATAGLELVGVYSNHQVFPNDHVLFYRVPGWRLVEATSVGEIEEIVWADPLSPPPDASPATRRRLNEIFGRGTRVEYW